MAKKKDLKWITLVLMIIGSLAWGLVAFGYNIVESIANAIGQGWIATVVYALVGLSGLYQGYKLWK